MKAATKTTKPPRTRRIPGNGEPLTAEVVQLHPLTTKTIKVTIVGTSPLICDQMPPGLKEFLSMTKTQQTAAKNAPQPKLSDAAKLHQAAYKTAKGAYGFPATAFKKAMVSFAHKTLGITKTAMNKAFFILPDADGLVLLKHKAKPKLIHDIARNSGGGSPAPRYRAQFDDWSATLTIEYNTRLSSAETLINLLENAGFSIGAGNKRPELTGGYSNGQWRVQA